MLIKNSLIFILIFSFAEAQNFQYKKNDFNLELLTDNNELNFIQFKYEIDEYNDVTGSLDLSDADSIAFSLKSKNIEYELINNLLPKSSKKTKKKIIVNWDIENFVISKNYKLHDVSIKAIYKGKYDELSISDKAKELEFFIYPKNNKDISEVYGYSKNAGEILAARNITKDITGGILQINGLYGSREKHNSIMKVKDFSIRDGSKFENLIKSTRFFDVISVIKDSQNEFGYMEVPISQEGDITKVKDAFVIGGLVGFTFSGDINRVSKNSNFDGFYGPLYLFDKYIDDIPLFNNLLTNNKNESLLGANFSVVRVEGKTSVTVNPLSLVTPGKTKRIFKIFDFLKRDKDLSQ
jgi:hypothetical protein